MSVVSGYRMVGLDGASTEKCTMEGDEPAQEGVEEEDDMEVADEEDDRDGDTTAWW